jgi:hypothetical protein
MGPITAEPFTKPIVSDHIMPDAFSMLIVANERVVSFRYINIGLPEIGLDGEMLNMSPSALAKPEPIALRTKAHKMIDKRAGFSIRVIFKRYESMPSTT